MTTPCSEEVRARRRTAAAALQRRKLAAIRDANAIILKTPKGVYVIRIPDVNDNPDLSLPPASIDRHSC